MATVQTDKPKGKAKIPRPRNETPKSSAVTFRITPELREALERFAETRQRSISHEAERLLSLAAFNEDDLGGPILSQYLRALGAVFKSIQAQTGKAPYEDIESYFMAQGALKEWITLLPAPKGGEHYKKYPGLKAIEDAKEEYSKAVQEYEEAKQRVLTDDFRQRYSLNQGLSGILLESSLSLTKPDSAEYYSAQLEFAKKRGNTEAIERFSEMLESAKTKESAETGLNEATDAVLKDVEKWRSAGKGALRTTLATLNKDA